MTALEGFRLPRIVDSTMLDAARICSAKFAFTHGFGYASPDRAIDLVAGGAFAAARCALYREAYAGRTRALALEAARAAFETEWAGFVPPADTKSPKTHDRTWELIADPIEGYAVTFDPPNDRLQPASHLVDPPFEWPFRLILDRATLNTDYDWPLHPSGEPFEYAGRLDEVASCAGLTIVVDDKTTSRFSMLDTWVASLRMRAQLIGYKFVVGRQIDPGCDSVVVRQGAIRASGVEWRESPLIPISNTTVASWLRTTRDTLERMVALDAKGEWPSVFSDVCVAWSRPCAFLKACTARDRAVALEGFAIRRWDPLAGTDLAD